MAFATESIFGYSISYIMDNRDTKNMNGAENLNLLLTGTSNYFIFWSPVYTAQTNPDSDPGYVYTTPF